MQINTDKIGILFIKIIGIEIVTLIIIYLLSKKL